ncbi:hypothetical protein WMY93_031481 [Mugilogobius chulae]|uniref:Uncharacterized protein n=1 Tax=Mugilogobius chulae TaxID=88201 RepID=A0AAW0MEM0_9GOBI
MKGPLSFDSSQLNDTSDLNLSCSWASNNIQSVVLSYHRKCVRPLSPTFSHCCRGGTSTRTSVVFTSGKFVLGQSALLFVKPSRALEAAVVGLPQLRSAHPFSLPLSSSEENSSSSEQRNGQDTVQPEPSRHLYAVLRFSKHAAFVWSAFRTDTGPPWNNDYEQNRRRGNEGVMMRRERRREREREKVWGLDHSSEKEEEQSVKRGRESGKEKKETVEREEKKNMLEKTKETKLKRKRERKKG